MPDIASHGPLLIPVAAIVLGGIFTWLSHLGPAIMSPAEKAKSIRAACAGLLLMGLSCVRIGFLLLHMTGWAVMGAVLLLASIPFCLLMATGALATPPDASDDMPFIAPWDDDHAIHQTGDTT